MVGLSVILETHESIPKNPSQVISKGRMIKPPNSSPTSPSSPCGFSGTKNHSLSSSGFLDYCFLCKQKLLPGKDIYMYKGDKAFCSVECRCRQIFMDEEESVKKSSRRDNCSLAAMKPQVSASSSSSSSSSSTSAANRVGKGPRNGANAIAY